MEQAPAYRQGIEDSIRRCEELLAFSPLAFDSSASAFRRSFSGKDQDAESSKDRLGKVKEVEHSACSSAEELWKRNMDLLISGNIKPHEKFCHSSEFQTDANKLEEESLLDVMHAFQEPDEIISKSPNNIAESKASGSHTSHAAPCQGTVSPEGNTENSSIIFAKSSVNSSNKCEWDSEWSAVSSEWMTNVPCQDSNETPVSQFLNSFQSSQKSMIDNKNEQFHVVLPLDTRSHTQSSINGLRSDKEMNGCTEGRSHAIEVTATRILNSTEDDLSSRTSPCIIESDARESDSFAHSKQSLCLSPDRFHSSESEEITSCCQSRQHESSSEALQATTPEGSGISQVALNVTWDASDRLTSPESQQRIDTTGSSSLKQTEEHVNLHRQKQRRSDDERRSRSVPKEACMVNKMPKYQRSRSVSKERCEPLVGRRPDPESMHSAPIIERILELQQRFGLRKRARKAYEKEELDNCSFWPRVNFRSQFYDKVTYQPIQDRFPELQRQKFEKIANAQLRMNMGLTFKPEINQKSIQLCKQKGLEMINVAERLSALHPSVHLECKVEPQKNQSTFAPEINKNTDYIISSSRQFKDCSVGFLKRQRQYMQTIEEKKRFF